MRMSFLPSAVIESRFQHIKVPIHKVYCYLFKLDGRITNVSYKANSIEIEISVPFQFMNNKSDVKIKVII